ncbi:DUF2845 domain-containing protein [Desulfoluna spongiiphila]|uniref:DUF2845 domain-containing protein n=1 Tax=Desulfoluna spongiiphila TaxID=419481 RepID=A0A1G5ABG8_9BACT|nr:DUF2845 domain-containing protein [Desulfoluna spongiiphila]SCX75213.1 Protein of unknown function [Desulfoluna spongiiphila]
MLKRIIIALCFILMASAPAFALRYGNNTISVGDSKGAVRMICGEPVSKEILGYIDRVESEKNNGTTSEKRIRVMKIEEWTIKTTNYNSTYYYNLVFEGNKLTEINSLGEKKY